MTLMNESINSPTMVAHCFKVICKVVKGLNHQQPHVITSDEPVYAIAKEAQWLLPDEHKDAVVMMGLLHTDMALLNARGGWRGVTG